MKNKVIEFPYEVAQIYLIIQQLHTTTSAQGTTVPHLTHTTLLIFDVD